MASVITFNSSSRAATVVSWSAETSAQVAFAVANASSVAFKSDCVVAKSASALAFCFCLYSRILFLTEPKTGFDFQTFFFQFLRVLSEVLAEVLSEPVGDAFVGAVGVSVGGASHSIGSPSM